jgi:hypothetical protein
VVCYTEVLDYTLATGYYIVVVLHTIVQDYTIVALETIAHYTMVVLQTTMWDFIVVVAQCYSVASTHIVMLHVQPAPCMYLQSFLSSSPRFYSPCLRMQLTYNSYNMYSSELSGTSASRGNYRDHAHVFFKSHTMVLLKLNDLA